MIKQLLFICIFTVTIQINSQTNQSVNRINGDISVPIFIDELQKTDYTDVNSLDREKKEIDKKWMLSTPLPNIPIQITGKSDTNFSFRGTGETFYGSTITARGTIRTVEGLLSITIAEILKHKVESFEENIDVLYHYDDLKVHKSIKSTEEITVYSCILRGTPTVKVDRYNYYKKNTSRYRVETEQKDLKGIDQETLQKKIKSPYPAFNFSVRWDGKYLEYIPNIKDSILIVSITEDNIFKSMKCSCPPFEGNKSLNITYEELTNIILNDNYQISNIFPNLKSRKEILNGFENLKEKLENKYGVKIEALSILENSQIKKDIRKVTVKAPLEIEGKEFCYFLKKITKLR
jgi:hypothetical protein